MRCAPKKKKEAKYTFIILFEWMLKGQGAGSTSLFIAFANAILRT